jgi:hypothetical protein
MAYLALAVTVVVQTLAMGWLTAQYIGLQTRAAAHAGLKWVALKYGAFLVFAITVVPCMLFPMWAGEHLGVTRGNSVVALSLLALGASSLVLGVWFGWRRSRSSSVSIHGAA